MNLTKAQWWLCLAQAFLPPNTPEYCRALREALPSDLSELAQMLELPVTAPLGQLGESLAQMDDEALLVTYSRLFLVPGDEHPTLNTAYYVDGALYGPTTDQLVACYRAAGLEKRDDFRDLPDHLTLQLTFVAHLFAHSGNDPALPITPSEFLARFVGRWATPFRAAIAAAASRFGFSNPPWLALAELIETAALQEIAHWQPPPPPDPEIAAQRAYYRQHRLDESDLEKIRAALTAHGLATDHLQLTEALVTPPVEQKGAARSASLCSLRQTG